MGYNSMRLCAIPTVARLYLQLRSSCTAAATRYHKIVSCGHAKVISK